MDPLAGRLSFLLFAWVHGATFGASDSEVLPVFLLLLLLLGILLFGGLGLFVAKVFFIGILIVFLVGLIGGGSVMRRR